MALEADARALRDVIARFGESGAESGTEAGTES
jgi:hypothetical protein